MSDAPRAKIFTHDGGTRFVTLISALATLALQAMTTYKLYNWFVLPNFNVPAFSFGTICGFLVIFYALKNLCVGLHKADPKKSFTLGELTRLQLGCWFAFFYTGYFIHAFFH